MLYWENNAYMYAVKRQLCIKQLVAEAACAASAYLLSLQLRVLHTSLLCDSVLDCSSVGKLHLSIAA